MKNFLIVLSWPIFIIGICARLFSGAIYIGWLMGADIIIWLGGNDGP